MPRPTTKSELLAAASASFTKLTKLWDGFTPEQADAPFPAALLTGGTEAHWQHDKCPVSYTHLTLPTILLV